MVYLGYNTGVINRKVDRGTAGTVHGLSNSIGGTVTMDHSTLPLFSLQSETKEIPLTQGKVAIVDAADFDWLMQWKWYARTYKNKWYAVRTEYLPGGQRRDIRMHRLILNASPQIEVDHKDGNGLNNTRDNLRLATSLQNNQNSRVRTKNRSGYKGVDFHKSTGKWRARIKVGNEIRYLGLFVSAKEAAIVYDVAAREFYGEFAWLNFPDIQGIGRMGG